VSPDASTESALPAIVAAVDGTGSRAIGAAVEALIRDGMTAACHRVPRLPTVRRVAEAPNVSPATVSVAWTNLRLHGWVHTARQPRSSP